MSDTVQALVLDDTVTGAVEPVHFAGFPGLWVEGRPVAVTELGFASEEDAYAQVEELGLPLERTTVPVGEGLMPEVANHVPEGVVPVFENLELVDGVEEPPPVDPFAEALKVKADELIPTFAALDELPHVDALLAAETAGKARVTVIAALEERRAELAPDVDEGTGE